MKTKIFILLTLCIIVTLSFAFTSQKNRIVKTKSETSAKVKTEPSGGFLSEDKM